MDNENQAVRFMRDPRGKWRTFSMSISGRTLELSLARNDNWVIRWSILIWHNLSHERTNVLVWQLSHMWIHPDSGMRRSRILDIFVIRFKPFSMSTRAERGTTNERIRMDRRTKFSVIRRSIRIWHNPAYECLNPNGSTYENRKIESHVAPFGFRPYECPNPNGSTCENWVIRGSIRILVFCENCAEIQNPNGSTYDFIHIANVNEARDGHKYERYLSIARKYQHALQDALLKGRGGKEVYVHWSSVVEDDFHEDTA